MSDASVSPSLRVSKASASAFTATPMEQDFLSAMAFRSARDFLDQKQYILDYWSEENDVLQEPAAVVPPFGEASSSGPVAVATRRPASLRKRLVIESAFASHGSGSTQSSPSTSPSPLRTSHDAASSASESRRDGGWTSGATRTAITRSITVRERTSLFENMALAQSTPPPRPSQKQLPASFLTKTEIVAIKKKRRLSFGFEHSWEYNNTDVTHDFEIAGLGNLYRFLQAKFDTETGDVGSDEKRQTYLLDNTNETKLRMPVANLHSFHSRVKSAPPGNIGDSLLSLGEGIKSFRDSLKGGNGVKKSNPDRKLVPGHRKLSLPNPTKRLVSTASTAYIPSPRVDMNSLCNITKEERSEDGALIRATLQDGNKIIVAGTKEALIKALLTDKAYRTDMKKGSQDLKELLKGVADPDFTVLFLMTHTRIAESSVELLKQLINEYFGGDRKKKVKAKDVDDKMVKERYIIIEIIHEWLEKFYYHFIPEQMSDLLKKLLKDISKGSDEEKNWAKILRDTITLKQTEHNNQESLLFIAKQVIGESAKLKGKNVKTQKMRKDKAQALENKYGDGHNVSFVEVDYKVMAEQIILLDCALMSSLQPNHLLGDVDAENKIPEVARVRKQSHNLVMWVASEICTCANIKQRTIVLTKFIEIALYLFHMRDFEGFLNIYSGLNKPQVKRLAGTWRGVDQGIVKSFQNLKRKIKEQGLGQFFDMATLSPSPKIPPLGPKSVLIFVVLLLDFLHLQSKAPETYKDTSLLNFVKYRAIGNLLLSLHTAEWIGFFFEPIMPLQTYLQKHLTVLSEAELTAASERIQKKKGSNLMRPHRSSTSDLRPKPKTEVSSKRKSIDRFFGRKSVTTGRSNESKTETSKRIHSELVAKWDRPLAQVSVHADVPRMVNKMQVLNKKTGPPSVWPSNDETASTSLHSIRGLFEALMRGLAMPELYSQEEFLKLFDKPEDDDSDIQQTVSDYMAALGEEHAFVKLLKCACSQGIVAPVWTWIKMVLLAGFPFKDVKLGWLVYVIFEGQVVHIIHQKKEQSNHDDEEPPRDPGDFDFDFTWELRMTFDLELTKMEGASFGISSFNMNSQIPGGLVKKLEKRVKGWKIDSFVAPEMQHLEKARSVAAATRSPSSPHPVSTSYDDFKKLVITNTQGISEVDEDAPDSRRGSKNKASPKRKDSRTKVDENRLSSDSGQGRRFKYRAQRDSVKAFYKAGSDDEAHK